MSSDQRPDPDAVLAKISADAGRRASGRLKIFLGYSAGVGKTFAMLEDARALEMKKGDVLAGYVEPHGRPETESLLLGLDILPYKEIAYRGITLREFDLDGALRCKPRLILVDELAHTNAEGCRHAKRWQDVVELLDAGIDVYTTLNIQHVESLNDIVGKISGIAVRETIPDTVFDRADEIELVDLPPEELIERFREGKVYIPEQAELAAERFFKKDTLVALRELALRKAAEHVNRQVELGRRGLATRPIWATRDRLMVAVGPSPTSAMLIRTARRMATELRCPWYAVAIERPSRGLSRRSSADLDRNLRLAESLGAEIATLVGEQVGEALVRFAHDRGITRMIVGKTAEPRWRSLLRRPIVDEIIRRSGDIDVLVVRGDPEGARERRPRGQHGASGAEAQGRVLADALTLCLSLAGATGIGLALDALGVTEANVVLLYILAIAIVAYTASRPVAVLSALLAMLLFNFFFTQPLHTFAVYDPGYLVTFAAMIIIGLVVSGLVSRVRAQAEAARSRADANEVLYHISTRLGSTTGVHQIAAELERLVSELLGVDGAVFLSHEQGGLGESFGAERLVGSSRERAVAAWVLEQDREAGRGTDTLPESEGWYVPLSTRAQRPFGVLGVIGTPERLTRERRMLITSIAVIASQTFEREALVGRAQRSLIEAEAERLRSDLLATVSHDLRTPLAAISGGASGVLASHESTLSDSDRALLRDVTTEAERLIRLVENLLHLSRLNEGKANPNADWQAADELIGGALRQVGRTEDTSSIEIDLPGEPLLCWADGVLITQVLVNLIDNAIKYADGRGIRVSARRSSDGVEFVVTDHGPGFPPGATDSFFTRFTRATDSRTRAMRGSGLGLAICKAAVQAHAGSISATNAPGGGACVSFTLPDPHGVARPQPATEETSV